jgi:hypothetical protein
MRVRHPSGGRRRRLAQLLLVDVNRPAEVAQRGRGTSAACVRMGPSRVCPTRFRSARARAAVGDHRGPNGVVVVTDAQGSVGRGRGVAARCRCRLVSLGSGERDRQEPARISNGRSYASVLGDRRPGRATPRLMTPPAVNRALAEAIR